MKEIFKKQTFMLMFSIVLGIFTMVLGVGYAFYVFDISVSDTNPAISVKGASVDLKITPVSGNLGLCKSYPISRDYALANCAPYIFSVANNNKVDVKMFLNLEIYNSNTLPASDVRVSFAECSDRTCSDGTYTNNLLSKMTVNPDIANQGTTGYLLSTLEKFGKNNTKYYKVIVWQDEASTVQGGIFRSTIGSVSYSVS